MTLLVSISTLVVAGTALATVQQANTEQRLTRDGQVTDRYTKAVDNLGNKSEEVRIGGLYALQRIGQDSPRDASTVFQVISAYIRTHAALPKKGTKGPDHPANDVAVALSIVIRPLGDVEHPQGFDEQMDLSGTNLAGANLKRADLTQANLTHANLRHANLEYAKVDLVNLTGADLTGAKLIGAKLIGAKLTDADLTDAKLDGADLDGADLTGADLTHANLKYMLWSKRTRWPQALAEPMRERSEPNGGDDYRVE